MQTIGVTDVTITYSRPGVKGRTIWGDALPEQANVKGEATLDNQNVRPKGAPIRSLGHVWRAGANEATTFVVTDDVLINGQKLPAGNYSLHTIPTIKRSGPSSSMAPRISGAVSTTTQQRHTAR